MPDEAHDNPDLNFNQSQAPSGTPQSEESLPHLHDAKNQMSNKLGDLEVQRVEASDELERIRNKSATEVQGQTDMLESTSTEEGGASFGDDGSGIMDILRESNLSPRHLRFCCGGIAIVLLLVALFFGGSKFIKWLGDRPDPIEEDVIEDEIDEEDTEEVEVDDGVPFVEIEDEIKYTDATVYSALLLGENTTEEDPSVDAGELLGEELVSSDSLTDAINTFADLFNALQVDVNSLLDQSRDRQDTLDDYVSELKYLSYKGELELEELRAVTDNLSRQFTEIEEEKNLFEERFFDNLSNLDSYGTTVSLNEFIVRGEEVVSIRAQYLARLKLIEYYELVLTSMERRITDIDLNEEALVKGIQVVDIEGSDIDLIIQEDEL